MTDITMCEGKNCTKREQCYRYTAKSERVRYLTPNPVNCVFYFSNEGKK